MDGAEEKQSDGKREHDQFSFWLTEMGDVRTLSHERCGYDSNGEKCRSDFAVGLTT